MSVAIQPSPPDRRQALGLLGALGLAATAGTWLARLPASAAPPAPALTSWIPSAFAGFQMAELTLPQVKVQPDGGGLAISQPYDDTLIRSYVHPTEGLITLALAYGREQRQEIKVHRPEICYTAAGYQVLSRSTLPLTQLMTTRGPVTGVRLFAAAVQATEAVSYWIRIGQFYTEDGLDLRLHLLREGLAGRVPDGMLVRASCSVADLSDARAAWPRLERFLVELVAAVPAAARPLLVT